MRSRKTEAADVVKEIGDLIGELEEAVAALNSIIAMKTDGKSHAG